MSEMRVTHTSRPFAAIVRGVPVLLALFLGVQNGRPVQGVAALYPDGTRAVGVLPMGEPN